MSGTTCALSYVVVSPIKDEERQVALTLRSIVSQTRRPNRWVIVDDGSTDGSAAIVKEYAERFPFIDFVRHQGAERGQHGIPEVRAFNFGYSLVQSDKSPHDVVVKLDCDLSFGRDYFERLLTQFSSDPNLGIASGVYLEQNPTGAWVPVSMPYYHAFGASKAVRCRCFEEIGGFEPLQGWDTVDEIRARYFGWNTRHFSDLEVRHHKLEGTRSGILRTSLMHGEAYYRSGGGPFCFALKVLRRSMSHPLGLGGVALAAGYCSALLGRQQRLVSADQAKYYRRLLRQRLFARKLDPLLREGGSEG